MMSNVPPLGADVRLEIEGRVKNVERSKYLNAVENYR